MTTTSLDALTFEDLTISYRQRPVVDRISGRVPAGVMSALVGPNGAGKSTLLKSCLGLVPADGGRISLLGQPVRQGRRDVAYVPQCGSVDWDFPISVGEVVAMGCQARTGWFKRLGTAGRAMVRECLERVGLSELADRPVGQLSGGQRQRTFFARALAQDADLLLLDEPFAGVDAPTEALLLDLLDDLCGRGRSVVVVHHDLTTVRQRFAWTVLLGAQVVAAGPTDVVLSPDRLLEAYGAMASSGDGSTVHAGVVVDRGLAWAT